MPYFRHLKSGFNTLLTLKHTFTHILIGLVYAWILREWWQEFSFRYIYLAAVGSVVPDIDHFLYFFVYGRREWYAVEVKRLLKQGQVRTLAFFLANNHKYNTGLATHNVYFLGFFILLSLLSFQHDWKTGVVFFGVFVLHLLFDVVDDIWVLGHVNESWKRLRRKPSHPPLHLQNQ